MNIHQAVERALGKQLATEIINRQGLHAAVLAAMGESDEPEVKKAISDYLAELRRKS